MTPWNACQFQALSGEIKQQAGSRASRVSPITSPDNFAEAHLTGREAKNEIDAACVGESGVLVRLNPAHKPLRIGAMGHGERQRARLNRHGFPAGHKAGAKSFLGFQTGDLVRAVIAKGKQAGTHVGRIAIRFRPAFALKVGGSDKTFDVHPKHLTILQRSDGYAYQ